MSSDQRESRHLYTYLYYRFLHSLRSVEMTTKYFLVSPIVFKFSYVPEYIIR